MLLVEWNVINYFKVPHFLVVVVKEPVAVNSKDYQRREACGVDFGVHGDCDVQLFGPRVVKDASQCDRSTNFVLIGFVFWGFLSGIELNLTNRIELFKLTAREESDSKPPQDCRSHRKSIQHIL